jgi:hypothetical protein
VQARAQLVSPHLVKPAGCLPEKPDQIEGDGLVPEEDTEFSEALRVFG